MSEEEKKAIERCKQLIKVEHATWIGISNQLAIKTVLNLIKKQEKVIDEMAQELINSPIRVTKGDFFKFTNKKQTKQYFYRKVENNE